MRFISTRGNSAARAACLATLLLAMSASLAQAQIVFDGNLLFNNGASGTLAGQFTGTAGAGAPACPGGTTAAQLGTITYPNNVYGDPLLPTAAYAANVVPNFQPGIGSPAFGSAVNVPNDGFFKQVCYRGAIGPNPGDDWTQGWTYYDSTGTTRNDLHLAGMPDPRPLSVQDNVSINGTVTWTNDKNYLVRGQLRIKDGGTLIIAPGTVVFEEFATLGTIIAERGGKLVAIGSPCEPIIITSDDAPGSFARGHCGGIVLNGRAKVNVVNSCAGDSAASEGGLAGFYGGNDDNDGSGTLRYVRVEYAGKEITPNNELNSFTFNGCGLATRADYCQAHRGADDSFEWFGGDMGSTHLLSTDNTDDGYDWQMGYRGRSQFVIVRMTAQQSPNLGQFGEKGIEADNNENNHNETQCAGRSGAIVANATFVGDRRVGASFPGSTSGVNLRRGTSGQVLNSIVTNYKTNALRIDDDATWQAHCVAVPAAPGLFCPGAVGVAPIATGNMLVARSLPNPFRSQVNLSFTLPKSGPVSVEIFSADGRHVTTLAKGAMPAGQHTLTWNLDAQTPSGMYFYKVLAAGQESTGKLTRID